MIILAFDPAALRPARTGPYSLDGVRLLPGVQEVADSDFARLQRHPAFADLLEQGAIVARQLEPSPAKNSTIVEFLEGPSQARVNLNTASKAELVELPGIGSRTAEKLIAARPFEGFAEAQYASGLPDSRWALLDNLVEI
jgi:DNA uptake protein ComE-like DNA-binding protein